MDAKREGISGRLVNIMPLRDVPCLDAVNVKTQTGKLLSRWIKYFDECQLRASASFSQYHESLMNV